MQFYAVLICLEIWMSPCGIGRVQSESEGGLRFKVYGSKQITLVLLCILKCININLLHLLHLLSMRNEKKVLLNI